MSIQFFLTRRSLFGTALAGGLSFAAKAQEGATSVEDGIGPADFFDLGDLRASEYRRIFDLFRERSPLAAGAADAFVVEARTRSGKAVAAFFAMTDILPEAPTKRQLALLIHVLDNASPAGATIRGRNLPLGALAFGVLSQRAYLEPTEEGGDIAASEGYLPIAEMLAAYAADSSVEFFQFLPELRQRLGVARDVWVDAFVQQAYALA
jgi:hypothetical protein